ncbi:AraC family transcriptional regulator [Saccharomonospora piscinae]|uniref:AraC family transcriptional regulator n=1 Tax=Saccharomonospora piscinae TaxID=687388 RepID=A0A1V9A678_SACPI|nr:helix-turn-helix transcriptional regulator [Saccharomonospora piscinae]OQO92591.1 AraC family transcriptional regulator [Saccharomonospora piscinae]TLW91697.1 helix-turn-helix transcriptional regulator [Saccharomonospora piscinae]
MDKLIENAIGCAIDVMYRNMSEQVTLEDMARAAMFSKFHFSRVFQKATGVSPGRFLAAMRLQEAKRLLLSTSLSVTEVSQRVGYQSVGTFSARFRSSVGMSPSAYRRMGGAPLDTCGTLSSGHRSTTRSATVRGQVAAPSVPSGLGQIFVGLFPDRLPQGRPVRCTALRKPGSYELNDVPLGTWYVLSYSVATDRAPVAPTPQESGHGFYIGNNGPITIRPETHVRAADVRLRPMTRLDPPVLLALLDERARESATT